MEEVRNNLLKKRFINELEFIKNAIQTNEPIALFDNAKVINLEQRLRTLQVIISKLSLGGKLCEPTNDEQSTNLSMGQYFNKIDNSIYKRLWTKLPPFHKCIKIKEFIDETYGIGKMQTQIIEDLSNLVHNEGLTKKQHIVYDPNDEKILSLPILSVSKDKYDIKLE